MSGANAPTKVKKGWGITKAAKAIVRSAAEVATKRYKGTKGIKNVVKDVLLLKSLVNVEKKQYIIQPSAIANFGQIDANVSGGICVDITPTMAQGVGEQQRIGNSVKLHSSYMRFCFRDQFKQTAKTRYKAMLVEVKGTPQNTTDIIKELLLPNQWLKSYNSGVNIYDYYSAFNNEYRSKYKVLATKHVNIGGDTDANQRNGNGLTIKMRYKNHHIKYPSDGSTTPVVGQLVMIFLADRGNFAATSSTLLGLQDGTDNTGCQLDQTYIHYIIDN